MKEEISETTGNLVQQAKHEYQELTELLQRERDELRVRVHLANADAQDQWKKIEDKWHHFQSRASVVAQASDDSAKEVAAATRLVGDEIKDAYRKIRSTLR